MPHAIYSITVHSEPKFLNVKGAQESIPTANVAWARIWKRLRSPGIDSKESIPPAYVSLRAGTSNRVAIPSRQARNWFLGSLKGLQIRALGGRYVKKGLSYKPARLGIDSWAPSKVYKFGLCYLSEFLIVQCAVFLQNYIHKVGLLFIYSTQTCCILYIMLASIRCLHECKYGSTYL